MSNLVDFAKREFEELGWLNGDDEMQRMACDDIIELLQTFSDQGHSGHSASYVLNIFNQLARWNPITEIKDEPEQWNGTQHKKQSSIFKREDDKIFWLNGVVFQLPSGSHWSSSDSSIYIELPIKSSALKTEVILIDDDDKCINESEFEKYVELSEKMVRPNIEGRKPKE